MRSVIRLLRAPHPSYSIKSNPVPLRLIRSANPISTLTVGGAAWVLVATAHVFFKVWQNTEDSNVAVACEFYGETSDSSTWKTQTTRVQGMQRYRMRASSGIRELVRARIWPRLLESVEGDLKGFATRTTLLPPPFGRCPLLARLITIR